MYGRVMLWRTRVPSNLDVLVILGCISGVFPGNLRVLCTLLHPWNDISRNVGLVTVLLFTAVSFGVRCLQWVFVVVEAFELASVLGFYRTYAIWELWFGDGFVFLRAVSFRVQFLQQAYV